MSFKVAFLSCPRLLGYSRKCSWPRHLLVAWHQNKESREILNSHDLRLHTVVIFLKHALGGTQR